MKCPACKIHSLTVVEEPHRPRMLACEQCLGRWLTFDDHLAWVEAGARPTPENGAPPVLGEESHSARFCPRCGTFMTRFRFSADHLARLDRCGSCGGTWFDAGEFEAVLAATPLERLQHVFSDAHQHRLNAELRRRERETRLRATIGDADYEKAVAMREWLNTHPGRFAIRAFLDGREI